MEFHVSVDNINFLGICHYLCVEHRRRSWTMLMEGMKKTGGASFQKHVTANRNTLYPS